MSTFPKPWRTLLSAISLAVWTGCGQPAPVGWTDFGAGSILEETDQASVQKKLGPAREVTQGRYSWGDRTYTTWAYPGISVDFSADGSVTGISLTGPGLSTRRGLHPGDTAERVLALHGGPYRVDGKPWGPKAAGDLPPADPGATWTYCQPRDSMCLHGVEVEFGAGRRARSVFVGWFRPTSPPAPGPAPGGRAPR
jgi:hypothetical protein